MSIIYESLVEAVTRFQPHFTHPHAPGVREGYTEDEMNPDILFVITPVSLKFTDILSKLK